MFYTDSFALVMYLRAAKDLNFPARDLETESKKLIKNESSWENGLHWTWNIQEWCSEG